VVATTQTFVLIGFSAAAVLYILIITVELVCLERRKPEDRSEGN
jgi:hypothetical protein